MNRPDLRAADRVAPRRRRQHREGLSRPRGRGRDRAPTRRRSTRSPAAASRRAPCPSPGRSTPAAAPQLPPLRPGADGPGARRGRGRRVRARGPGQPERVTLYRLGTLLAKSGETGAGAGGLRARARPATGSRRGQQQPRRAAGPGRRPRRRDRALPGRARGHARLPRRAQQPGLCAARDGPERRGRKLYERALALQPDFPEALNNIGLLLGRAGDLEGAERYFREALAKRRHLRGGGREPGAGSGRTGARPRRRRGSWRRSWPRRPNSRELM